MSKPNIIDMMSRDGNIRVTLLEPMDYDKWSSLAQVASDTKFYEQYIKLNFQDNMLRTKQAIYLLEEELRVAKESTKLPVLLYPPMADLGDQTRLAWRGWNWCETPSYNQFCREKGLDMAAHISLTSYAAELQKILRDNKRLSRYLLEYLDRPGIQTTLKEEEAPMELPVANPISGGVYVSEYNLRKIKEACELIKAMTFNQSTPTVVMDTTRSSNSSGTQEHSSSTCTPKRLDSVSKEEALKKVAEGIIKNAVEGGEEAEALIQASAKIKEQFDPLIGKQPEVVRKPMFVFDEGMTLSDASYKFLENWVAKCSDVENACALINMTRIWELHRTTGTVPSMDGLTEHAYLARRAAKGEQERDEVLEHLRQKFSAKGIDFNELRLLCVKRVTEERFKGTKTPPPDNVYEYSRRKENP
jgi:hypothetical protein